MIYELRIYTCIPGRLAALNARFANKTLPLWAKHGIKQAGFWTTAVGTDSNALTYMIAWESMADRETRWTAFTTDPEWIAARNESEKDGLIVANIVSSFLAPTAYSSVK